MGVDTFATAPFVRLQIGRGMYGVTKLRWRAWPSRNALSWAAAAAFLAVAATAVLLSVQSDGPAWFRWTRWIAVAVLVVGVAARLVWEGTAGRLPPGAVPPWDRRLADPWWTGIHTATGLVLGLFTTPLWLVAVLAVLWEILEISVPGFGDEEVNGNRLVDVIAAIVGWVAATAFAMLVAGRSLAL